MITDKPQIGWQSRRSSKILESDSSTQEEERLESNCSTYRCRAFLDSLLGVFHLEQMPVWRENRDRSVISRRHRLGRTKYSPFCKKLEMTPPFSQHLLVSTHSLRSFWHSGREHDNAFP